MSVFKFPITDLYFCFMNKTVKPDEGMFRCFKRQTILVHDVFHGSLVSTVGCYNSVLETAEKLESDLEFPA